MHLKLHLLFHVKPGLGAVFFQVGLVLRVPIVVRVAMPQLVPVVRSWRASYYFNPNLCEHGIELLGLNERILLLLGFNSPNVLIK